MEPKNFILTADLYVRLDYDDLKGRLKSEMTNRDNYLKGYLDNDETMLYYRSDFLAIPGFIKIPMTQLIFKRTETSDGRTKIKFRLLTPILLIFGLAIVALWSLYLFDIEGLRTSDSGYIIPLFGTIALYGIPFMRYMIELTYFRDDLKRLE